MSPTPGRPTTDSAARRRSHHLQVKAVSGYAAGPLTSTWNSAFGMDGAMRLSVFILAFAACGQPSIAQAPKAKAIATCSDQKPPPVVTRHSTNEWNVELRHTLGSRTMSARIVVTVPPTDTCRAPHSAVASAEAWLGLARSALKEDAPNDAVYSARRGIAELGGIYSPKHTKDDTGLHLHEANAFIIAGQVAEGAEELASVLASRIGLYYRRYNNEVRRANGE